jgi:O-antigen/teichoic acid export membrane protein
MSEIDVKPAALSDLPSPRDALSEPLDSEMLGDANLRTRVLRGLAWSTAVVVTVQVARLCSGLVLVHFLQPHDYGVAGMALLASSFVLAISDLGLGAALVQRPSISEADRSTVFWANVATGALLTVSGLLLAGPFARFFHQPQVRPLLMVLSIGFFITSLAMTQSALFQRAMNFRAISIRLMIAHVAGAGVAITVAALGGGAWALIAQALTVSIVSTSFLWLLSSWRPRLVFSRGSLRDLGGFGFTYLGSRLLDYAQANADNLLVGRYLGSTALGLYSVSYNVILLPLQRLFVPVQDALYPALSRIQDDVARLVQVWLRVTRLVGAVSAPTMLGLIVVAPDFTDVVLGRQWADATPVIRILAAVTLMQGFNAVGERMLMAQARVSLVFRFSMLRTVLSIGAFVVGLRWGLIGVAACYAIVTIPVQLYLTSLVTRSLHIGARAFITAIAGVAEAAIAMFLVCWAVRVELIHAGVGAPVRLVAIVALGVVVYLPILWWRSPEAIREIRSLRRGRPTSAA